MNSKSAPYLRLHTLVWLFIIGTTLFHGCARKTESGPLSQPQTYPYALQPNTGNIDVKFSLRLNTQSTAPLPDTIKLKRIRGRETAHVLTDDGMATDASAADGVYTATISIATDGHAAGDCLAYEALAEIGRRKFVSPAHTLCFTAFPLEISASDLSPDNILTDSASGGRALADELLVWFEPGTAESRIEDAANTAGAEIVGTVLPTNLYQLRFPAKLNLQQLGEKIKALAGNPGVLAADFNLLAEAAAPTDPKYGVFPETPTDGQNGLKTVILQPGGSANNAWDLRANAVGAATVDIAVIDSGADGDHPDFTISPGVCRLQNGCGSTDATAGAFAGHGTKVGGIIGALSNNGTGIAGLAQNSDTLRAFAFDSSYAQFEATLVTIASSFPEIDIANFSYRYNAIAAGATSPANIGIRCTNLNNFVTANRLFVVAAGNDGNATVRYPGACNQNEANHNTLTLANKPRVIVVANAQVSCSSANNCSYLTALHSTSSYNDGSINWVDLAAPGTDILTLLNGGTYGRDTGTSFAAPLVAAGAALLHGCGTPLANIEGLLISNASASNLTHPGDAAPPNPLAGINLYNVLQSANTAPSAVNLSNSSVSENTNTSGGFIVGNLSAVDNICDQHTLSITGGADSAVFSINSSNQLVLTAGVLNFEVKASYAVTITATDFFGQTFPQSITVTVTDQPEAPVITQGASTSVTMSEDGSPTPFSLTLNATDPDTGAILTWSILTPATNGTATATGTGTSKAIGYTPTPNFNGTDSFVVRVTDNALLTDNITVNVTVNAVADAPVITQGASTAVTLSEDGSPTPFSLTLNATDPDTGAVLTWSIQTAAANGTATATGTGTSKAIGYTPTPNFSGADSFVVRVTDNTALTDNITVNVTVNAVADAPVITQGAAISVTMSEDGSPAPFSLTLNATDPDTGAILTWSILTPATNGTATATGTGTSKAIGYTPTPNFSGTDSFVVRVTDNTALTDNITVNVTVNAVADAPVITQGASTSVTLSEDGSPTPFSLTLNATDPDTGAVLTWSILTPATNGAASATGTGTSKVIGYTPTPNFSGIDSFVVRVSDNTALTDDITVNVTVNAVADAPVITQGAATSVTMSENGSPAPFNLTLNATDPDSGAVLTWSILTPAGNGTATATGTGASKAIGYTPNLNYNGADSFVVRVSDNTALTDDITVNVTITAVGDPPVITQGAATSVTLSEDGSPTPFSLTLNATDPDTGAVLTWSILTPAASGTATATGTGTSKVIGYTPTLNFNGTDSFVVRVSDETLLTDDITVNVTVNPVADAPVITQGASIPVTMSEDGSPASFNLTLNATDPDTGAVLTWSILTPAASGTATATGTGTSKVIGYTPNPDFSGADSFVVRVTDNTALTDDITVNVTVSAVEDAPVITEGASTPVTMSEDGSPTAFNLTLNATDPDTGAVLTWSILTPAASGTATATGTGTSKVIGYTPTPDFNGTDSFVVRVSDETLLTDDITVNVTVNPVADAPVITEGASTPVTMSEDGSPTAFNLTLNATDPDTGAVLTWSILTPAASGTATATGTGTSKVIGYTPTPDFNGTDSFVVRVSDNTALTDDITVNVTVTAVGDPPVITEGAALAQSTTEGDAVSFMLNATDIDSATLTWSIATTASNGVAAATGTGLSKAVTYTPNGGYTGADSFVVQVSDGTLTDTITVTMTISPDVPPAPPTDVSIVMDRSGSMGGAAFGGGSKMAALKDAAKKFITQLSMSGTHRLGMTQFHTAIETFTSPFPFQVINSTTLTNGENAIDSINSGGGTNLIIGVDNGATMLHTAASPQMRRVMVLFTDGYHNTPSVLSDAALETALIDELDDVTSAPAVDFYSLGFGASVNDNALIDVAAAADNGWHVNEQDVDPLSLGKNFTDVAQDIIDNQPVYDPIFDLGTGPQQLLIPVNSRDSELIVVVSWDATTKPEEILTSIRPPLGNCLITDQPAPGLQLIKKDTYRIYRFILPHVCGGLYARAGEWILNLDSRTIFEPRQPVGSVRPDKSIRVNALSYVRSPTRLFIKPEILKSLFTNRLALTTKFENLALPPGLPRSGTPRFSVEIRPPLPKPKPDATADARGGAEGVQSPVPQRPKNLAARMIDLKPDDKGMSSLPALREPGIYQIRVIAEATDESGHNVRRERIVTVYNEPARAGKWLAVALILLALLILFLRRRTRTT